ncbi:hypothetical protein [Streptomyces parvus]|uniref:hypothetical protein n=1 Tax=Streptomyces parvus TaxID=66428 RepID=UPI0035D7F675
MKKFLRVIAVISLGLALFGGCAWSKHSEGVPQCDGKTMRPGDVCRTIGGGSSTEQTYEEAKQGLQDSIPFDQGLLFGGIAVFTAAVVGVWLIGRRERGRVGV